MIDVVNLTKKYGNDEVVKGVSFSLERGESTALWGLNGSGKTTIINAILGLSSSEGIINVGGINVAQDGKNARALIGFVPQYLNLYDGLTVKASMDFYAQLRKASSAPIDDLLVKMNLIDHSHKFIRELSGGMKQRLALAIALISNPPILILDEPTASLDIDARNKFWDMLTALKYEGKTLFFASHRMEDVVKLADRVLVLENGELVKICSPFEIASNFTSLSSFQITVTNNDLNNALNLLHHKGIITSNDQNVIYIRGSINDSLESFKLLIQNGIQISDINMEHKVL